jgi:hypothetical protein
MENINTKIKNHISSSAAATSGYKPLTASFVFMGVDFSISFLVE